MRNVRFEVEKRVSSERVKLGLYSIRDEVACSFGPPMVAKNDRHAVRSFLSAPPPPNTNKEDFALYFLGYWDDTTGAIEPVDGAAHKIPNDIYNLQSEKVNILNNREKKDV